MVRRQNKDVDNINTEFIIACDRKCPPLYELVCKLCCITIVFSQAQPHYKWFWKQNLKIMWLYVTGIETSVIINIKQHLIQECQFWGLSIMHASYQTWLTCAFKLAPIASLGSCVTIFSLFYILHLFFYHNISIVINTCHCCPQHPQCLLVTVRTGHVIMR